MPRPWDCDDDCPAHRLWHNPACTAHPGDDEPEPLTDAEIAAEVATEDGYAPSRGASQIRHPAYAPTRRYLAEHPLPQQRTAGGEAA